LQTVSLDEVKNGLLIKIKQLLLKRKNLRQRNQQRRRNNFSRKKIIKSIGADFSPLFIGNYLALAET
jgi:hypothetical protein